MKQLVVALVLVSSVAAAQPSAVPPPAPIPGAVPPPAPIPALPGDLPTSPVMAMPAGGYTVLPGAPHNPNTVRKIGGGVTIAAGIGLAILGGVVLSNRPFVPALDAPGWFDAKSSYDQQTVGGFLLIGAGVMAVIGGGALIGLADHPYGEAPGSPALTF